MFDQPVLHPSRHQQHDTSQYYILITEGNILNAAKDATEQIEKAATPTKGSFFFQISAKTQSRHSGCTYLVQFSQS